jgi:glycosyltransferase involved in cell wall biosynthesis
MSDVDVLFVCTNSDLSGAPQYVRDLAISSQRKGYSVVVAMGGDGPIFDQLSENGIRAIRIRGMRSNLKFWTDIKVLTSLCNCVLSIRPKIIHCHSAKAAFHSRLLGVMFRCKVLYTVHGWGFGEGRKNAYAIIARFFEQILVPFTDFYIAVSDRDRQVGIETLGIDPKKIATIVVGVRDLRVYSCQNKTEGSIVMVGRFGYQKDHRTLFLALTGLTAHVSLIGEGTDSAECRALANELCPSEASRIAFLGQVQNVYEIASKAVLFVLSTKYEGLPAALIEAQSMGIPAVASNVGGIPEIIVDGVNGFLVNSGDPVALNHAILRIINNRELLIEMGKRARQSYEEKFRYEISERKNFKVFSDLITRQ